MEYKNTQVMSRTYRLVVLILLISPCFSKDEFDLKPGEEIDQIDYKGPETHPFIPPPSNRFGPHSSTVMIDPKFKGFQQSRSTGPLGRKGASRGDQVNVCTQQKP